MKDDRRFVTALARGLDVLRCFTQPGAELGTAEIARMTTLPQPTVWRLCYTLVKQGYLVQPPGSDKLRAGIPLLGLGYAAIAAQPVAELARPEMQAIATRHQGAVSLGARDGTSMIYLQRCQGASIVLSELRVGSRVPIASSATGWAYMAGLAKAERTRLFDELRRALGKQWATLLPRVGKALRDFERTGYVVNKGSLHDRINAVAVPVRSRDGSVLLSLSSGGISDVFDDAKLRAVGSELKGLAEVLAPALTA